MRGNAITAPPGYNGPARPLKMLCTRNYSQVQRKGLGWLDSKSLKGCRMSDMGSM